MFFGVPTATAAVAAMELTYQTFRLLVVQLTHTSLTRSRTPANHVRMYIRTYVSSILFVLSYPGWMLAERGHALIGYAWPSCNDDAVEASSGSLAIT